MIIKIFLLNLTSDSYTFILDSYLILTLILKHLHLILTWIFLPKLKLLDYKYQIWVFHNFNITWYLECIQFKNLKNCCIMFTVSFDVPYYIRSLSQAVYSILNMACKHTNSIKEPSCYVSFTQIKLSSFILLKGQFSWTYNRGFGQWLNRKVQIFFFKFSNVYIITNRVKV